MRKIFLWGYYGSKNVGDDLLLSLLLNFLSKYDNVKIQVVVSEIYKEYELYKNVDFLLLPGHKSSKRFIALKNIILYIKAIKNNDLVIFGGGTSLFETDKTKFKPLITKYIIFLFNTILYKRPILHLGVGIGTVKTRIGKFCLKKILNNSDHINLREKESYIKALSLTKNTDKVSLGGDLAYLCSFTPKEKNVSYNIGISLFQYYGYISEDNSKIGEFYDFCKRYIECILAKHNNVKIHLFSFQTDKGGKDEQFNLKLKSEIISTRLHFHPYDSNTIKFIDNLKSMDLCIGMRLHFLIISVLHGIPILGLNYQPKIKNELLSLGLEELCFELDDIFQTLPYIDMFLEGKGRFDLIYKNAFDQVILKNAQAYRILSDTLLPYIQ